MKLLGLTQAYNVSYQSTELALQTHI